MIDHQTEINTLPWPPLTLLISALGLLRVEVSSRIASHLRQSSAVPGGDRSGADLTQRRRTADDDRRRTGRIRATRTDCACSDREGRRLRRRSGPDFSRGADRTRRPMRPGDQRALDLMIRTLGSGRRRREGRARWAAGAPPVGRWIVWPGRPASSSAATTPPSTGLRSGA